MFHLERMWLLRQAAFGQAFDLADAMIPEDLQLTTARFIHELLDPINTFAKPLLEQRMIDRRFDLARIGTAQWTAPNVPPDGVSLIARHIHLRKHHVTKALELGVRIPVELPVTPHGIIRIVLHDDASFPSPHRISMIRWQLHSV